MKRFKVSTLRKYLLLTFTVSFLAGSSIAGAEVLKPAFAARFEKKRVYKARPNNVITVKQRVREAESKKPAFAERFEKKRAYKKRPVNVIAMKRRVGEALTLKDHYDMKRAYKKRPVNVIALKQRH